jgi:hypothetical protein
MQKGQVISIAKSQLLSSPFDIAHDVFHHYKVWENVMLIAVKEGLKLDFEKLEIASWWHDYERGSVEHLALTEAMQKTGYSEAYIKSVKDLINTHSFSDKHSDAEEAKVLFDADKLEYVNSGRLVWIGEGILQGLLDPQTGRKYGSALHERIYQVVQTLHYPTTRSMMLSNITNIIAILTMCQEKYKEFLVDVKNDELVKAVEYLKSVTQ